MTQILHENGIEADVSAVTVLLSKDLPVSTVHRVGIKYVDGMEGPVSLFLKLGGPVPFAYEPQIGRAEVEFYNLVAPTMSCPPLVKCYDAAFDQMTGCSHILLEDLTDTHTQTEQNLAPSADASRRAVEALGKAHAFWWSSPMLGNGIGRIFDGEWLLKFVEDLNRSVAEFLVIAELTARQKDAYRLMLEAAPKIWGRLTDSTNLTVTHGDMHWWNFLFPKDFSKDSVSVFDWHLWHIDLGARDLAFLLALGGFAEPRPEIEEHLLRIYHDALIDNGVKDYSGGMLYEDYRFSAVRNLNIPVIFQAQGKHHSTWQTALRRAFDSFERLRCDEIL